MTDELKKIIFSPRITKVLNEHNWVINTDSKSKFHSYFVGDIADYYLNVQHDNSKIHLQFALDIEIPKNRLNELLILINIANQNLKEGFFVFDFKFWKINFNLIPPFYIKTEESSLDDFLKNKLDFTKSLFHNFVCGVHNLFYGEKIETASLELLFLNNEGCA